MGMHPIFYCSDIHIGTIRSAGTTPATAYQLRLDLIEGFGQLLEMAAGCDLLINGDLFDKENIPMSDLYGTWMLLRSWLQANEPCRLVLLPGNHDLSKTSTTFTSFDLLVNLLQGEFGSRAVTGREGFGLALPSSVNPEFAPQGWVIPHMPNQDLFDLELQKVPAGTKYLFLHCNYDNGFAAESDHSLNLSAAQAAALPVERIVLGHEHQRSEHLDGKVVVVGNQIPSSVSDCLGNDKKYALKITDRIEWIGTCDMAETFQRLDWRNLSMANGAAFIRVEGEAAAHEASEVVAAISALRKTSKALVITNSVKVEGSKDAAELAVSLDQIQSFNVMGALLDVLSDDERAIVKGLLETHGV